MTRIWAAAGALILATSVFLLGAPDGASAGVVPDRAAPGPAPDRTPPLGTPLSSSGGPAKNAVLPPSGALLPRELALKLQALGDGGVEIRTRTATETVTHRVLTPDVLDRMLPTFADHARRGAAFEIRSLDPRVQHLSGVTAEALDHARRRGAGPAVVLQRGDGAFGFRERELNNAVLRYDPTWPHSSRWNPLSEVRLGDYEVRDAQNIADILVDPNGDKLRDHWDRTAHALLTA